MTCEPCAVTWVSAQSGPSSLSARSSWTFSSPSSAQTDWSNGKYLCWPDSPLGAKSFCWVCHALAHMVKPSKISRQITYKSTAAVAKLRTSTLHSEGCVLDPRPSHTNEFKHDITVGVLPLGAQHWENGTGRPGMTGWQVTSCVWRWIF